MSYFKKMLHCMLYLLKLWFSYKRQFLKFVKHKMLKKIKEFEKKLFFAILCILLTKKNLI